MFNKSYRFTFQSPVPKNSISTHLFSLRYEKTAEPYKVTVVIGKKVSKNAVERNAIKRKFRAIIKDYISDSTPFTLVFYIRKGALDKTPEEIRNSIEQVFEKIGIIQ